MGRTRAWGWSVVHPLPPHTVLGPQQVPVLRGSPLLRKPSRYSFWGSSSSREEVILIYTLRVRRIFTGRRPRKSLGE